MRARTSPSWTRPARGPAAGIESRRALPLGWRGGAVPALVTTALVVALAGATGCGGGPSVEELCTHIADVTLAEVGSEDEATRTDTMRACMESFEGRRVNGRTGSCVMRGTSLADVNRCVH